MSKVIWLVFGALSVSTCEERNDAPPAGALPAPESHFNWSMQHLLDGQDVAIAGPKGHLRLNFFKGRVNVTDTAGATLNLDVVPPASILWRPDGRAVAINNGNGSGQTSDLLVVSSDDVLRVSSQPAGKFKSHFASRKKCAIDPSDISVSAVGWSLDSTSLLVRIEDWDRNSECGSVDPSFVQMNLPRLEVSNAMSEAVAMKTFCREAGFRELFEPNCVEEGYHD